ncbi:MULTISPECIES: hypothetical protein [Cysteiniphilum]|uniref:hypothetical protein n=1 Tax=Cysteiniphilum TaxID=2056696 RepID=UPI00177CC47B|nr:MULTISPECIES: hypothetical protein [Cysteiniphilum]
MSAKLINQSIKVEAQVAALQENFRRKQPFIYYLNLAQAEKEQIARYQSELKRLMEEIKREQIEFKQLALSIRQDEITADKRMRELLDEIIALHTELSQTYEAFDKYYDEMLEEKKHMNLSGLGTDEGCVFVPNVYHMSTQEVEHFVDSALKQQFFFNANEQGEKMKQILCVDSSEHGIANALKIGEEIQKRGHKPCDIFSLQMINKPQHDNKCADETMLHQLSCLFNDNKISSYQRLDEKLLQKDGSAVAEMHSIIQ